MGTLVTNPPVPYVVTIPDGPLQPGRAILLLGCPMSNANRFSVNAICGPRPDVADIAFHIDARFDMGRVVRNNKIHGNWGEEEILSTWKFPFRRGEEFALEIFISPEAFMVAIDGRHFCSFAHRVSVSLADTLQIKGDVKILSIHFKKESFFPSYKPPCLSSAMRLNVANLSVPLIMHLDGGLPEGKDLRFQGKVKPIPKRFHINLQKGAYSYPHPTIAFHFNPRFEDGGQMAITNSYIDKWGTEEKVSHEVHLKPNLKFDLRIRRLHHGYEVLINDKFVTVFSHRISPDIVDTVAVDGDVVVFKIEL